MIAERGTDGPIAVGYDQVHFHALGRAVQYRAGPFDQLAVQVVIEAEILPGLTQCERCSHRLDSILIRQGGTG